MGKEEFKNLIVNGFIEFSHYYNIKCSDRFLNKFKTSDYIDLPYDKRIKIMSNYNKELVNIFDRYYKHCVYDTQFITDIITLNVKGKTYPLSRAVKMIGADIVNAYKPGSSVLVMDVPLYLKNCLINSNTGFERYIDLKAEVLTEMVISSNIHIHDIVSAANILNMTYGPLMPRANINRYIMNALRYNIIYDKCRDYTFVENNGTIHLHEVSNVTLDRILHHEGVHICHRHLKRLNDMMDLTKSSEEICRKSFENVTEYIVERKRIPDELLLNKIAKETVPNADVSYDW